jgi:2-amino-4-hydroxy-6-hydroxymethyldihydropteridine diphosphokinase
MIEELLQKKIKMIKVFLSLGTNLGNKQDNLLKAIKEIGESLGHVVKLSGVYETTAWGFECDDTFLNQVIVVETDFEPLQLINCCLAIEKKMGRERKNSENYESRIIDIDILFYGEEIVEVENLQIPHSKLHLRRFILTPLNEIAPDLIHPILGESISKLLEQCTDTGSVKILV